MERTDEHRHTRFPHASLQLQETIRRRLGLAPTPPSTAVPRAADLTGTGKDLTGGDIEDVTGDSADESDSPSDHADGAVCQGCYRCTEFVPSHSPAADDIEEEFAEIPEGCMSCGCALIKHIVAHDFDDRDAQLEWSDDEEHLQENITKCFQGRDDLDIADSEDEGTNENEDEDGDGDDGLAGSDAFADNASRQNELDRLV
eukprot:TRINITY_DN13030_c0_g1_i1.p1 TRINITY_DN13030_c0_g1~~TRINITY_DN13030_c0_g1_i1.p1  ORF type:complete len:201 (-),score=43.17 TRINITY_DN13030_c0_g1_i1:152-754(-)